MVQEKGYIGVRRVKMLVMARGFKDLLRCPSNMFLEHLMIQ